MKNLQFSPSTKETKVEFLLLISRIAYRVRMVTASTIRMADPGEWQIDIQGEEIIIALPKGRAVDSQNRAFVTDMRSFRPVRIALPFGHAVSVSSLGANPRYYVRLPRACSVTFEPIKL